MKISAIMWAAGAVVTVGACEPAADPPRATVEAEAPDSPATETANPLVGRWWKVVRSSWQVPVVGPTLEFRPGGVLVVDCSSDRERGRYQLRPPSGLVIDVGGERVSATYEVTGDTLLIHASHLPEPDRYIRVRGTQ